ncbi:MAG: hypothetical protein GKS06_09505 [Acidobacteria bacterium]|nr:hypothetical protein [Acidobacteriota bacterium]
MSSTEKRGHLVAEDQTPLRMVAKFMAASGAVMMLGGIGILAFGGNVILGAVLIVAAVGDLAVAAFMQMRS